MSKKKKAVRQARPKRKSQKKTQLPFWATALTVCGVIILCGLGTWQLERLQWKTELIAALDAAYENDKSEALNINKDFFYGKIGGKFLPEKALLLSSKVREGEVGYELLVPVALEDTTLIVNLGWTGVNDVSKLPIHHGKGDTVYFTGLLRKPEWNNFTPENQPAKNIWYRPDPQEIATAKGLENISPRILYAESSSYKFDGAFPNNARQYPSNNHLQYAAFWFAMAGALAVVYALRFLRK